MSTSLYRKASGITIASAHESTGASVDNQKTKPAKKASKKTVKATKKAAGKASKQASAKSAAKKK